MTSEADQEIPRWFVLNHVGSLVRNLAQKEVDRFNAANKAELELFAPVSVIREERGGEIKLRKTNLTFHYVFVKATFDMVKKLCLQTNGFSFLIDRGNKNRYAVIEDSEMVHFMNIARAYNNCLPYFSLDDVDLEEGDLVEVVSGDFPGLVGTFMPKARSKTGDIVLQVFNKVGTIAFNVKSAEVRVLEFSDKSTRANDQIDAFVPHLLKALRDFDNHTPISVQLAAKLSVFCGRMGMARLNNHKLNARLQMLLYAANTIIGNMGDAARARERYQTVKESVTNEWTKAANRLILYIITNNKDKLIPYFEKIKTLDAVSKAQRMVRDEYDYYLNTAGIKDESNR